jgi:hypothetical protein
MLPVLLQTAVAGGGMDVFSFTATWLGLGLFFAIIVFIVLEFISARHRHDVEDKLVSSQMNMINNSIALSQNQQQQYNNYMNWWMNFQNQEYTTEVGLRREAMQNDNAFMNKMLAIFQMWAQANIMQEQQLGDALSRFLNVSTIALIWQLAQNGMFIEDILQLIGINASTDQIAKLIELLNNAGVHVQSRIVPPVQIIENPSTQSAQSTK